MLEKLVNGLNSVKVEWKGMCC